MVIRGPGGKKWEHGQNRLLEVSTKEAGSGSIGIHRDLGPLGIWVPTMMDPGDRGFHHQKRRSSKWMFTIVIYCLTVTNWGLAIKIIELVV